MTTQVIVNVDSRLKVQAMKLARAQGIPFSVVLKLAIKAFVEGRFQVDLVDSFNNETKKEIQSSLSDISNKKKGLSPKFSSAKDAIKYLKS